MPSPNLVNPPGSNWSPAAALAVTVRRPATPRLTARSALTSTPQALSILSRCSVIASVKSGRTDGSKPWRARAAQGHGGDDGPAARAELNGPHSLVVAGHGDLYIADTWNNRVRKIDARSGRITNVAGTGRKGFSGDGGPALAADFGGIYCLALDKAGQTLDLADLDHRRIRRIDLKTGIVTTVAGNGKKGVPTDGELARSAPLVDPRAVALDGRGNLYILERSGHALRVVDRTGRIRTVAGTGKPGDSGNGGAARQATAQRPEALVC